MDQTNKMKVIIALVSHGSVNEVIKAIKSINTSIIKNKGRLEIDLSILIIENKSYDDLKTHKEKLKENISLNNYDIKIKQIENKGYSNAINFALNYAREGSFEYLIAGNPDIEFSEDYFNNLSYYLSANRKFSIAVPSVYNNGINQNPRVESKVRLRTILMLDIYFSSYVLSLFINYIKYLNSKLLLSVKKKNIEDFTRILIPCGVQYIFNIRHIPKSLMLDENIFLWGEELLLSYKLKQLGLYHIYFKNLKVHHDQSTTVSLLGQYNYYKIAKKSYKYIRKYYFLLNK
tara:strand:+ start:249 stop:1115 length:867 start_codon:yes stop_codon:yes gene_type:complete